MEPSSRTIFTPNETINLKSNDLKRKNGENRVVTKAKEALSLYETSQNERPSKKQKVNKLAEPQAKKFNFIYDQFTENRGDPKMLEITCKKCHTWVMDYQKDGPGNLLRCYVDRIYHPSALRERTFTYQTISSISSLKCKKCLTVLATPMIYTRNFPTKEVRAAYKICSSGYKNPSIELKERLK